MAETFPKGVKPGKKKVSGDLGGLKLGSHDPASDKFSSAHEREVHDDRNGNKDDVFKGKKYALDDPKNARLKGAGKDKEKKEYDFGATYEATKDGTCPTCGANCDCNCAKKGSKKLLIGGEKKMREELETFSNRFALEVLEARKAEKLDEISREKASDYIMMAKRDEKKDRKDGINLALQKKWGDPKFGFTSAKVPAKESVEIDELSANKLAKEYYPKAIEKWRKEKSGDKSGKELDAIYLAGKKMSHQAKVAATEEVEDEELTALLDEMNLDEVSKAKLTNYIRKATYDYGTKEHDVATKIRTKKEYGNKDDKEYEKDSFKRGQRYLGISRAANKLGGFARVAATEEVEVIDEISKEKAGRYVKAADDRAVGLGYSVGKLTGKKFKDIRKGQLSKVSGRQAGISLAVDKLTGKAKVPATEEVENLDELSPKTLKSYEVKAAGKFINPEDKKDKKKLLKGITTAARKIVHEEVSIVDAVVNELSKDTLGSYLTRASSDMTQRSYDLGARPPLFNSTADQKAEKIQGRMSGIQQAVSKLAKPDPKPTLKQKKVKTTEEVTEEGQVDETLSKDASAADYIHDFVHSDNKKFDKDSKKQRINRAIGAYFGKGK